MTASLHGEAVEAVLKAMLAVGVNFDRPAEGAEVVVLAVAGLLDRWADEDNVCQTPSHDEHFCERCEAYEDAFSEAAARLRSTEPRA